MSRRYVIQSEQGGWDVVKEGHRRATAHAETKSQAVGRARALTQREGGGEVIVTNEAGKIAKSTPVSGAGRSNGGKASRSKKGAVRNARRTK